MSNITPIKQPHTERNREESTISLQERLQNLNRSKKKKSLRESEMAEQLAQLNLSQPITREPAMFAKRGGFNATEQQSKMTLLAASLTAETEADTTAHPHLHKAASEQAGAVAMAEISAETAEKTSEMRAVASELDTEEKPQPLSKADRHQDDKQQTMPAYWSSPLSPMSTALTATRAAEQRFQPAPLHPDTSLETTSVTQFDKPEGQLKYHFSQWGNQHAVNILTHAQQGHSVLFQPSDPLVYQRMSEQFEQRDQQKHANWQMADEHDQPPPKRAKPETHDEDLP